MMTAMKRVGPMPTHRLAMRHPVNYSSLDHFSSDDSSSSSSSKTSSGSSTDALSDSASSCSSSDQFITTSPSCTDSNHRLKFIGTSLSRKRSRSPVASVPLCLHTLGALYYALRLIFYHHLRGLEDESTDPSRSRGTDLEIDVDVERSDEIKIDPEIQAEIDEYFAYCYALDIERLMDRVTHPVVANDILEPDQEGAIRTMPNTRSGASRTREGVNKQSDRRMAETLRVRDAVRNLRPLMGNKGEQEEVNGNGRNGNGGNGNGGNGIRVVGLTRCSRRWKQYLHSNCPEKYQSEYAMWHASEPLQLTWMRNSHKMTSGEFEASLCKSWDKNI
ncbi:hypothetical protein Tco_1405613 [Tanacetum coccineum]